MEGQRKEDSPIQSEENGRLGSRKRVLTDHEMALIDEMLLAVAQHGEVELRVRKSPWGFVASVWCHDADAQERGQIKLGDSGQSSDGGSKDPTSTPLASGEDSQRGTG